MKKHLLIICGLFLCTSISGQTENSSLTYHVELGATAGNGTYAPLWFTGNRYGLGSTNPNSGYLLAGISYEKQFKRGWRIEAGLDMAGGIHQAQDVFIHQIYSDFSWKMLTLSIGSKERPGFPLTKNTALSSGMMVEGPNAEPVPQIRGEIKEYLNIPGTKGWLAFKGHIAYGSMAENNWQQDYVARGQHFVKDVLYHSKSLMLRLGNKERFPLEFEAGILMAAQFGGNRYRKQADGSVTLETDMPENLKAYWKAFFPQAGGEDTPYGEQTNIEGNQVGSWNFALNCYMGDWKFRAYLEHYFEDHSQMFWEYGRWKDGQLGLEITFPKNRWITSAVWEGISTKDQTGPLLHNGFDGQFPRIRANHLGISGNPSSEWSYRLLISFARYWGTYYNPLDKQRKQFYSLYEAVYSPRWAKGWSASLALGLDRGNYLGNSTGGMLTIKKTGIIF